MKTEIDPIDWSQSLVWLNNQDMEVEVMADQVVNSTRGVLIKLKAPGRDRPSHYVVVDRDTGICLFSHDHDRDKYNRVRNLVPPLKWYDASVTVKYVVQARSEEEVLEMTQNQYGADAILHIKELG